MPQIALPAIIGAIGIIIKASGPVIQCYVVKKACQAGRFSDEPFEVNDLASSIIPALNETVMLRAESEGLLSSAAAVANTGPCGVPQYNFDMCKNDLRTVTVRTTLPARGVARFDNVPPTCMVLSTVLTGGCGVAPPYPTVCGSACLQYSGLSEAQLNQLGNALRPHVRPV
ncbi:hypothetical protein RB595_010105 [Gaeumannomyces hyphopodioides]